MRRLDRLRHGLRPRHERRGARRVEPAGVHVRRGQQTRAAAVQTRGDIHERRGRRRRKSK